MRFAADCSFQIGAQHLRSGLPCQDYAVAGTVDTRAYAIVSDGCSSGGRTDVGARLIALREECAVVDMVLTSNQSIPRLRSVLGLNHRDTLATLVKVVAIPPNKYLSASFGLKVQGDGVVAIKSPSGLTFTKYEWKNNAPCYPVYEEDDFKGFIDLQGGLSAPAFHVETWWYTSSSGYHIMDETYRTVEESLYGSDDSIVGSFVPGTCVAVFSDGVFQVDGMAWQDVVTSLMEFKSTEGAFVKRRLNRFLSVEAKAKGRGPLDDIAMAAIIVQE